nr:unnamed protein product [Leishmania braziliensis]
MGIEDLHGKYTAKLMDGVPAPTGVTVEFSAGANSGAVRIRARVVNIMNGVLKVKENKLSGSLISTMMAGSDDLMAIEGIFLQGFTSGVTYTLREDGKLVLQLKSHTIEFVPA